METTLLDGSNEVKIFGQHVSNLKSSEKPDGKKESQYSETTVLSILFIEGRGCIGQIHVILNILTDHLPFSS